MDYINDKIYMIWGAYISFPNFRYQYLPAESFFIFAAVILNVYLVWWDTRLRHKELPHQTQNILRDLKGVKQEFNTETEQWNKKSCEYFCIIKTLQEISLWFQNTSQLSFGQQRTIHTYILLCLLALPFSGHWEMETLLISLGHCWCKEMLFFSNLDKRFLPNVNLCR